MYRLDSIYLVLAIISINQNDILLKDRVLFFLCQITANAHKMKGKTKLIL